MKALTLIEPGHFALTEQAPPPLPTTGEARVRVHRVGICGTDIHAFRGRQPFFSYPRILGHELGVEVVAVGADVTTVQPGDRCSVEPYLNCGHCRACRRNRPNCCAHLQVLGVHTDGGMRELFNLPAHKLHVANDLRWEELALIETLGIGAHAVERAQINSHDRVLIIGAGPIGLAAIQWAQQKESELTVLDIDLARLDFCRSTLGVPHLLDGANRSNSQNHDTHLIEQASSLTDNALFDVVIDATGNQSSMQRAFHFCGQGATLVFVGLFSGDITFHDPDFHRKELSVLASRNSTATEFQNIIAAVRQKRLDTNPWLTHQSTPEEFPAAFPDWLHSDAGLLKGSISFTGE